MRGIIFHKIGWLILIILIVGVVNDNKVEAKGDKPVSP